MTKDKINGQLTCVDAFIKISLVQLIRLGDFHTPLRSQYRVAIPKHNIFHTIKNNHKFHKFKLLMHHKCKSSTFLIFRTSFLFSRSCKCISPEYIIRHLTVASFLFYTLLITKIVNAQVQNMQHIKIKFRLASFFKV